MGILRLRTAKQKVQPAGPGPFVAHPAFLGLSFFVPGKKGSLGTGPWDAVDLRSWVWLCFSSTISRQGQAEVLFWENIRKYGTNEDAREQREDFRKGLYTRSLKVEENVWPASDTLVETQALLRLSGQKPGGPSDFLELGKHSWVSLG